MAKQLVLFLFLFTKNILKGLHCKEVKVTFATAK